MPREGGERLRPLGDVVRLPRRSGLTPALERALDAAARLHLLRTDLAPVPVRATDTTTEAGAYRYVRTDPIDLRVSRRTGRAMLGFLHELGHFVDHQLGYDVERRAFASTWHPAFGDWRRAIERLVRRPAGGEFDSPRELWARSYAQTILLRSRDPELEAHLAALLADGDPFVWAKRPFAPVAATVEAVFRRFGLAPA